MRIFAMLDRESPITTGTFSKMKSGQLALAATSGNVGNRGKSGSARLALETTFMTLNRHERPIFV
jgi:hypothetical protein